MVFGVKQCLNSVYEPIQAIQKGTLFPELFKPMLESFMPADNAPVTQKQADSFAAWEIRLYLDTHPDDVHALALYRHYCKAENPNYACTFVNPNGQDSCCGSSQQQLWNRLDDPWPWERQASCCGREDEPYVCI